MVVPRDRSAGPEFLPNREPLLSFLELVPPIRIASPTNGGASRQRREYVEKERPQYSLPCLRHGFMLKGRTRFYDFASLARG